MSTDIEHCYDLLSRLRGLIEVKRQKKPGAKAPPAISLREAKLSELDTAALGTCVANGWVQRQGSAARPTLTVTDEGSAFLERSGELARLSEQRRALAAAGKALAEHARTVEGLAASLARPGEVWSTARAAAGRAVRELLAATQQLDQELARDAAALISELRSDQVAERRLAEIEARLAQGRERMRAELEGECGRALARLEKLAGKTDTALASIEGRLATVRAEVSELQRAIAGPPAPSAPAAEAVPGRADRLERLERLASEARHLIATRGFASIPALRASMCERHRWDRDQVDELLPDLPRHDGRFYFGAPSPQDAYLDGLRIHGQAYFYVRCSDG